MKKSLLTTIFLIFVFYMSNGFAMKIYQGKLEIIYVDSHQKPQKIYRLRFSDGSTKKIDIGKRDFNYEPGTLMRILAKEKTVKDQKIIAIVKVLGSKRKFRLEGISGDANGDKKLLVVKVTDSSFDQDYIPFSDIEIAQKYFGTSLSVVDYIQEASNSKLRLSGDLISVLSMNNFCVSDNFFDRGIEEDLLQALETVISDISIYKYVSFVVPDRDDCLANAAGIGTLGKLTYNSSTHGNLELGVNFVRAYNTEEYENSILSTAIHELGHNLGLNHSNANSCGVDVFNTWACIGVEYGDAHNIMGTPPNLSHFNTLQKEDLGWLDSTEILTINNSSLTEDIRLLPVSSTESGIKMIKIRRSDGSYYSVEYRQAIGYDAIKERNSNSLNFSGFLVYLDEETLGNRPIAIDSEFEDFRSSSELISGDGISYYINFDVPSVMHDRALFSLGEVFNDTTSDISVSAQSLDSDAAIITVNKGSVDNSDEVDNSSDEFDAQFVSAKTLSPSISLKSKKATKVLLSINRDNSSSDTAVYQVKVSSQYKKVCKIKKNKFTRPLGAFIRIKLASQKAFQRRGFFPDSDGFYNIPVTIEDKNSSSGFSPVQLTLKAQLVD